jgi:hypothetical protein
MKNLTLTRISVCLVSILRLHSLYIISISKDPTFDNSNAAIWSVIEMNVGIICGSLATLRPLISRLFPKLLSSKADSLPTHNRTVDLPAGNITDVVEIYQANGIGYIQGIPWVQRLNASRNPSSTSSRSESKVTDDTRTSSSVGQKLEHPIAKLQKVLVDEDIVPPVPEKDYIRGQRTQGPANDIFVTIATQKDNDMVADSESERTLMFKIDG